jgi:hypothetical protein
MCHVGIGIAMDLSQLRTRFVVPDDCRVLLAKQLSSAAFRPTHNEA